MRVSRYRKKINKKIFRIILGSILLLVCVSILIFVITFHIEDVEVVGNTRYTEEEMKDVVLKGPFSSNSFLISWLKGNKEIKNMPFVDSIKVEMVSNHKIRLLVNEKQIVGYVKYLDCNMYFDKDGNVVESEVASTETKSLPTTEKKAIEPEEIVPIEPEEIVDESKTTFHAAVTDVPLIEGLDFGHVVLNQSLPVKNKQVFNTILGIARMVEKFEIQPDKICFDKRYNITMYYGDIQVLLGKDSMLEEKVTRVAAILPKLSGKSGVLHLEDYTDDTVNIVFSSDVPEESVEVKGTESENDSTEED